MSLNQEPQDNHQENQKSTTIRSAIKSTGGIDKKLLEILVCPIDKGKLIELKKSKQLECTTCKEKYAVKDGIPIMLIP